MSFQVVQKDRSTRARLGLLTTAHGQLETPFFMPVGTNGTVKGLSGEEIRDMGSGIILSNTYHLFLRPGMDIINQFGGLHRFMAWDRVILTDSGGYQVFSLAKLRKVVDEGVTFQSHLDGSTHFFTPEDVIRIQCQLGSDIMMPLDECAPYPCGYDAAQESVQRTTLWARRSREFRQTLPHAGKRQLLFGIIQGAGYEDLRRQSGEEIRSLGFDGYAIGGVSVGEPVDLMFETVGWVTPSLPADQPRYLMGIGLPDQIVRAVAEGIDMFDTCVPTRLGRHGTALTSKGKVVIRNGGYAKDEAPLDEACDCFVCRKYTRSYLRHLCNCGEVLALRFISHHNVHFYIRLLQNIRAAIKEGTFTAFQKSFLENYENLQPSVIGHQLSAVSRKPIADS